MNTGRHVASKLKTDPPLNRKFNSLSNEHKIRGENVNRSKVTSNTRTVVFSHFRNDLTRPQQLKG